MKAKETLKSLRERERELFVVHYSCENLNDNNEGYSPRVTSIAVLHVQSSTMHSFSIHLVAEEEGIFRESIDAHYDELEGKMLARFYDLIRDNPSAVWLHWNMTNINFGFEALAHRYRVLTKADPVFIPDAQRHNLSSLILSVYGRDCVDHPRMQKLMELNDGTHRDIISGKDEVDAFHAKEYIKLHKSTMGKTYWFGAMYRRLQAGKVRTTRSNWRERVNRLLETTVVKMLSLVAILFSVYQLLEKVQASIP